MSFRISWTALVDKELPSHRPPSPSRIHRPNTTPIATVEIELSELALRKYRNRTALLSSEGKHFKICFYTPAVDHDLDEATIAALPPRFQLNAYKSLKCKSIKIAAEKVRREFGFAHTPKLEFGVPLFEYL